MRKRLPVILIAVGTVLIGVAALFRSAMENINTAVRMGASR